ncbi:MAG: hypothetical protein ACYC2Y_06380 [Armatimonadota bacterium]
MASSRRSRGLFLDKLDTLTTLGLQFGGLAFALVSAYLIYGIFSGYISSQLPTLPADRDRVVANIVLACKLARIAGMVTIASVVIRYFQEEMAGYMLLIVGALFYWGAPIAIGSSVAGESAQMVMLPVYVAGQYMGIGLVALVASVPVIAFDVWTRLVWSRRPSKGTRAVLPKTESTGSKLRLKCWQTPYCREYLRKHCKAHQKHASCWQIKSGCYCDEDLILQTMRQGGTPRATGMDQKYSAVAGSSRRLSGAQKRERCRQCFLYGEHQKQKYRLISPLVFPIVALVVWTQKGLLQAFLGTALTTIDKLAAQVSFLPNHKDAVMDNIANSQAASGTVEWVFIVCIGLIMVTYMLRALEYLIFEMQI